MRLAYLYSRYPVLSQTFCDTEMLALERLGIAITLGSIHPPLTTIRHPRATRLQAPVHYAPPQPILRIWEKKSRTDKSWPEALVAAHEQKYGSTIKATTRARNATYFAELFVRQGVEHFHVHFANRAAHTALFLKAMTGIPFSITAHGQDFMADLGNDDLLREICEAAEFVAVETEYSRGLMAQRCPESAGKIHRVYNGMNLANFPEPAIRPAATDEMRILSVGRLVAFKGFEYLIEACEQLRQRNIRFRCEIIGDGPLREKLQQQISHLHLGHLVTLEGALPQDRVVERLRSCDIFALASTMDDAGASDVFPTVILEAMASGRPVVSTTMAGIPEAVLDKETGLLVPAGESGLFADALEILCRDPELCARYGSAGRARIEDHFQITKTVLPLVALLEKQKPASSSLHRSGKTESCTDPHGEPAVAPAETLASEAPPAKIAYLIDRWPDKTIPLLETELFELQRRNCPVTAFVCDFSTDSRMTTAMERLAISLEFLPDPMALEAEWQANRKFVLALEDDRANDSPRAPAGLFLRQARFAITLQRMFASRKIAHVHATSSRALLCGVLLKKLLGITLSASIERKPALSREVIEQALQHAVGGRIADRKLLAHLGDPFIADRARRHLMLSRGFSWLKPARPARLTRRGNFWKEWVDQLDYWSSKS